MSQREAWTGYKSTSEVSNLPTLGQNRKKLRTKGPVPPAGACKVQDSNLLLTSGTGASYPWTNRALSLSETRDRHRPTDRDPLSQSAGRRLSPRVQVTPRPCSRRSSARDGLWVHCAVLAEYCERNKKRSLFHIPAYFPGPLRGWLSQPRTGSGRARGAGCGSAAATSSLAPSQLSRGAPTAASAPRWHAWRSPCLGVTPSAPELPSWRPRRPPLSCFSLRRRGERSSSSCVRMRQGSPTAGRRRCRP